MNSEESTDSDHSILDYQGSTDIPFRTMSKAVGMDVLHNVQIIHTNVA